MSAQEQNSEFLKRLAKGIASLFGDNCEVTVHDLAKDLESSIIAIENGHVTGRRVGDGSSEVVLRALKEDPDKVQDDYNYLARTKSGRMVKSSSIYLRDKKGKLTHLFGINYDITDLVMARHALEATIATAETDQNEDVAITSNVNDLLDQLIAEADKFVGKPVAMMSKDDKIRAIQFLNDKGAFLVKKAGDKISKHYDISKYTLYNYMSAES
ncbi:MAG: helix-turn-helix transcriptional regulator [Planctomycetaceae bacterium]|nr:helix-turn-helix transcriptional regulator [Planctomycetaceae bacterium]